jgi:tRNA G26 N,N-dimethylase Trm1
MVTRSECEHDIGFYRAISGDGGDVVEECSKCGTRVATIGPKTVYKQQLKGKEAKTEVVQPETSDVKALKEQKKVDEAKKVAPKKEDKPIAKKFEGFKKAVAKSVKKEEDEEPKRYTKKSSYRY